MRTDPSEAQRSTEGMVDYDRNSAAQQQLVNLQAPRIQGLVERLGLVEPELRIVDYGSGPGASTIGIARSAIEAYRARFPQAPIAVCHADQPGNDWNALFRLATGASGYLRGTEAVRMEAAIGSFYDQMATAGSVALGTCFAASHWLSHAARLHAPGTVFFADLAGEPRADLAARARQDWIRFLRLRALELRPGGSLLVATLGAVPDPTEPSGAAVSGRGIYRALQVVAQGMADDGLIDRATLDNFLFALWFMTADEAREPLEADPVLAGAFEIEDIRVEPAPVNPADIFVEWIADPAKYAEVYTGYTRAFADSTLRTQLLEPSAASKPDADRLAEEFYRRFARLYQDNPGKYAFELWHLTVVVRKT